MSPREGGGGYPKMVTNGDIGGGGRGVVCSNDDVTTAVFQH